MRVQQGETLHDEAGAEGRWLLDRGLGALVVSGGDGLGLVEDVDLSDLQPLHDELDEVGDVHSRCLVRAV